MQRLLVGAAVFLAAILAGAATGVARDVCGPFTDVPPALCPYVLEMYYLGITAGTSPTTYSPDSPTTRGQAAVFVSKGVNQAITRSSRRAALGQWWNTQSEFLLGAGQTFGVCAGTVVSDGTDLWLNDSASCGGGALSGGTPSGSSPVVSRVRASDGRLLETWSGVSDSRGMLVAMGRIFLTASSVLRDDPGRLYMIDPSQPPGSAIEVAIVGNRPGQMAFDGERVWVVNGYPFGDTRSLSIVTPSATFPWSATTVPSAREIRDIVFDGSNVWIADDLALRRLDDAGAVVQTVAVAANPLSIVFDGSNLWVSSAGGTMTIVQVSTGNILATRPGRALAFDGERMLVSASTSTLSLWRAADLSLIGTYPKPSAINGVCSDGLNFWLAVSGQFPTPVRLVRF